MRLPDMRWRVSRGLLHTALWVALGVPVTVSVAAAPPAVPLEQDPVVAGLVREALAERPELAGAEATAAADAARVPQVRALPDPVLSLGVQNDGFRRLQIGRMETSSWSVVAAQTIPGYGKRALRARVQSLDAARSAAGLDRARLTVQAEVERAYLGLLEARDQLRILEQLETLWARAEALARARYETGAVAQSDLLRAQLERSRLRQRRWSLVAEERRWLAGLNHGVGRPLDQPLATALSLGDLADPVLPDSVDAEADAMARSPELQQARLAVEQSGALVSLARRDYVPDLTVSGGVMPRGGAFEPMWQAGVSLSIPLWAGSRQARAVREYELRGRVAGEEVEIVRRLLRQRLEERRETLAAVLETNRIYREGLLVQSAATVASTLAQYEVGRVSFASVLEALSGFLSDEVGFQQSVANAQRLAIAQHELSLDPVTGPVARAPGGGGMDSALDAGGAESVAPGAGSAAPAMPTM